MATVTSDKSRGASTIWLQGLLCGALAALAPPLALLVLVLLAPAAAAAMLEGEQGRPVARILLLFGLAASIGPARRLWGAGDTLGSAWSFCATCGSWPPHGGRRPAPGC
jgi:hypothetical protein